MKNKLFVTIFMGVVTVALAALCIVPQFLDTSEKPTITVPYDVLVYEQGEDASVLLQGVSAYDEEDGDISANVRVYDFSPLTDGERAAVTYAVYDSDNNLGKATRVVAYIGNEDITDASQTDADVSEEDNSNASSETTEDSNELSGTGYDDPELDSVGAPVIRLLTHEVLLDVGDEFYYMDYIDTAVDDKDTLSYLYRHISLEGDEVDTSTPGNYEVQYYCTDSDHNDSNIAKLMVRVGDGESSEEEDLEEE